MVDVEREQPSGLCQAVAALGGFPKLTAGIASLGAVGLAVAPMGSYSPRLAVLTATLVALIWYAYFTFRVARPEARVVVESGAEARRTHFRLHPQVTNPTERRLYLRIFLYVWVEGTPVPLGEFYQGERFVPVDPDRSIQGFLVLDEHLGVGEPDEYGDPSQGAETARIEMHVEWIDGLCEKGESTPLYWQVDFRGPEVSAVVDPERIRELFGDLPT